MSKKTRKRQNKGRNSAGHSRKPLTKKVKILIIAGTLAAVVLIILAAWWVSAGSPLPGSAGKNSQTTDSEETNDAENGSNSDGDADSDGKSSSENGSASGNGGDASQNQGKGSGNGENGTSEANSAAREEMTLPYTIPGTDLVIDAINKYSGVFVEDGSDEEVSDIFAIHVNNQGENVEYSSISLEVNGKELNFTMSDLPSDASVSVLESSRASYEDGTPVYLGNQTAYIDEFDMLSSEVGIVVGDDNGLTVTNLTDEDIPCLRIFYKFAQDDEYLGGITYTAKIDGLDGGDSITIYPSHFAKAGSKIMMVRMYETTE